MDEVSRRDVMRRIEAASAAGSPVPYLSRCGLRELPDAVRRLTHLESLDLRFNSVPELRRMPRLRHVRSGDGDVDLA